MSSPPLPHDLDDVRPATGYPGAQRHHRLGISSSRHPGAGLGVFALSTLQTRSGGWRRNILCRYTGKKITYQAATADSYSSDYLVGWEEHDEAIDGAFATPPALGHLINDDFSRDGGSVEAVRDPRHPHHTFLILVEDVPRGSELSYAYGGPYWEPRLCALPQTSRSLCILKYRSYFHPARLAALGLSPTGASPTPAIPLEVPPHQRPQSILHWLHYRPSLRGLAPSFLLHPPCSPPPLCMDVVDQETLPLETLPQLSRVPSLPPATHSPPSVASHPLDSEPMQPSPLPTLLFPVSRLTTIPFPPDHCMYSSRCSSPMDGCSHPPSPVAHSSMADPLTPTHLPATSPFAPTPMDVSSLPIFTGPTPPPDQFSPPHPPDSPARPPMLDISEAPQPLPPPLLLPSNLLLSPPNSPTLPSTTPMDLPDSPQSRPSNLLLPLDRPPSPPQFPTRPSLTCPMDLPSLLSLDPSRITPSHSLPVPDHVFLRPLVVQHGNIRLWVHQASSACLLDMDADLPMGLTHWILSGHARLGCAMNLPTPLTAVCRPDGTCGHQFAAFAAICKGSFPSTLSSSWFFAAPPQRSLLLSTLGLWAHRPDLPVSTSQKVQAAVDWLSKGCPSLFPIADWLSFQDVSAILTPSIPCSFWGPVSRSPRWSSWHLYDGSSDHGLDIAARACTFASTLRPSRLNGSILHHHFVPWQTPPTLHQDFQCAVQVLSELLLTSFLHDPNDLGYTSSDTYRLIIAGHPSVLPQRASTFRPTPPATRLAPPTPPTTLDSPPRRTQPFPTCPLTPPLPGPSHVMDLRSISPLRSPDSPLPTLQILPTDLPLSLVHSRAPPAPSRSTPLDAAVPLATCSPLSLPLSPSLTHLAVPMDTDPSPLPSRATFLRPPPAVASLPKRRTHPSSKHLPPSVPLLSIKHFLRPALQTKELPLSPLLTMTRSHLLAHLASSPSPTISAPSLTARGYTILPPVPAPESILLATLCSAPFLETSASDLWQLLVDHVSVHWQHCAFRRNAKDVSLPFLVDSPVCTIDALARIRSNPDPSVLLGCLALSIRCIIRVFNQKGELLHYLTPPWSRLADLPRRAVALLSHAHCLSPLLFSKPLPVPSPLPPLQEPDAPPPNDTVIRSRLSRQKDFPFWLNSSNLQAPTLDLDRVRLGSPLPTDLILSSLNVNGLTDHKFTAILSFMSAHRIGVLCLQDTRCKPGAEKYFGRRLRSKLGDLAKLFHSVTLPLPHPTDTSPLRVGGSIILTNDLWGKFAHSFKPDPTGLGVLSSLQITVKGKFSLRILNTYWPLPAPSSMTGSLWNRLQSTAPFQTLLRATNLPDLSPLQYLQHHLSALSDTHCSKSPSHMAFICGDLNSPLLPAPFSQGGTHPSCLPWVEDSGWRHPLPALDPEPSSASAWLSHFNRTGTSGSSWIDQILFKGPAPISPSYLNIDQGGFWLGLSDHRPITAYFSSPLFDQLTPPAFPKGLLRFPAPSLGKRPKDVEVFVQKCNASPLPALPQSPSPADCQAALDQLLLTSRAALPKHALYSPSDLRCSFKDGWSPVAAGLKRKLTMTRTILSRVQPRNHFPTPRWSSLCTRNAGILSEIESWETYIHGMSWPTTEGTATVDPMVWSTGTSALEWRELASRGGLHDIEATCKRDIVLLLRRLQGRSRRDLRSKFLAHSRKMEDEFAQLGRLKGAVALLSAAPRTDLPQSAISMPPPEVTLPSSIPDSPEALHRYLTSHFDSLFAADTPYPPPHLDPLSWDNIQSWTSFRSSFSHLGIPASDQSSVLWRLWDALCNVPGRAAVADDLHSPDSLTPSLEDFLSCLRDKSANTAGGPTGLDYRTLQAWPAPMKHKAYEILSGFWSHKSLASQFKWRWLVPIPKPSATSITDFRPIMLIDVLRKLWTSLVVARLVSTLLRHQVLSPSHHAFLPRKGTDTANLQIINAIETAFNDRKSLYGSSWDIKRAFDSVSKPLIRLAWRRLGIPPDIAEWLVLLDLDSQTVVRTEFAYSRWLEGGIPGLTGLGFTPGKGTGQGDVCSPITWLAVFDILLTALSRDPSPTPFQLYDPSGSSYAAPEVSFADDLVSIAAALLGLQRKADIVSGFTILTGMSIASSKLRLFHIPGIDEPPLSPSSPPGITIHTLGWVPSLIPFPREHSFKNLGVWYDTVLLPGQASRQYSKLRTDIASSARLLRTRKASPRLTAAVLRSALLPKSAYPSVLSSWSLTDLQEFDRIFASQYRLLAKDSSTSQQDALFQPRAQGGMGFPRFSHLVIERKLALLRRALSMEDPYTRWAAESILRRGCPGPWTSATLAATYTRPGYWISSVIEYLRQGDLCLATGPSPPPSPSRESPFSAQWILALSPPQRQYLASHSITCPADITTFSPGERLTTWLTPLPRWLPPLLPAAPPPLSPFLLSSGQWWYSQLGPPSLTAPALLVLIRMTAPPHALPTPPVLSALLCTIAAPFPSAMIPHRILHTRTLTAPFSSIFPSEASHFRLYPAPPELTAPLPPHSLLFGRVLRVPLPCPLSPSPPSLPITAPSHIEDVYIGASAPPSHVELALSRAPLDIQGSIAFSSSLLGWHTSSYLYSCPPSHHPLLSPASRTTLLYALTLRAIWDCRLHPAPIRILLPCPKLLAYVQHSSSLPSSPTRASLIGHLRTLLTPNFSFALYKPRAATSLPQDAPPSSPDEIGAYWTSWGRAFRPAAVPGFTHSCLPLASLLPAPLSPPWSTWHAPSGFLPLLSPPALIDHALRWRALLLRDRRRSSRPNTGPYWYDNTIALASQVMRLPNLSIAMAGHATRLLHCRHLSVRSNVIKSRCPHSPEWISQGACPLRCHPEARDSYDHWASECTHPQLLALRSALLHRHREDLLALSLPQQDLANALLDLFLLPDGFRVALGNLSHSHSVRLFPLYLHLSGPPSSRDDTFLMELRRLTALVDALWTERTYLLDTSTPRWTPPSVPKGSSWYAVLRHIPAKTSLTQ